MKKVSCFVLFTLFLITKLFSQPVWKHFNESVFEQAKKENKPVLLHLRANWCHWCHVMEEKTYRNKNIISVLNKNYITCSEDHDERQDLNSLYKDYGWPATIIFDANGNEIFKEAGYIPADEFYATLVKIKKNSKKIESDFVEIDSKSETDIEKKESLKKLQIMFRKSLSFELGGFNFNQKYIDFDTFEYALTHFKSDSLSKWITNSVKNSIGICDTVWGGMFQYSTNGDWNHVHYEKLLFIQARYIKIYCWYYQLFKDPKMLKRAENIAIYVDRFLKNKNGGYYNAQDADLIKGEKAHEYYNLSNAERLKKGVPEIDTNVYTSDNAQYSEALTILWATSGNQTYLTGAINCTNYLNLNHKKDTLFQHGKNASATTSLKDNACMARNLILLYRATQNEKYKKQAYELLKNISTTFSFNNSYFYTYVGKSAIKAPYNISENIETCRLLNYASYIFNEPFFKQKATEIFNFLVNSKVVNSIATEPGILSAFEEIATEPIMAALMLKKEDPLKDGYLKSTVSFPHFYFYSTIYNASNITEDKKDIFNSLNTNFVILCTSSYCSSPMTSQQEISDFIYKRVLSEKK
ncbi:MAG: thioredoxin domain-containing protein [Bacteroidetes bacterium]|nr:thioredoxin domain-containing protein [Bacteroidota bacterium]